MVQDKANGTIRDLRISPVKSATLSLSYYTATLFSTLIICFAATGICLTYVAIVGWNMLLADIFFLFLDILLLVLFGTALSSIINFFLSTQGQISAVGTIISAGYGFICGAYMPISSFGKGLQKIISFLPGTYGTSLIRNHTMQAKRVKSAISYMPIVSCELPYEGAKEMLLVDEVDNKEFLTGLFHAMYDELPTPKPKKKK